MNHAFLRRLRAACGRRRIMLALDTEGGRIVVRGWRERLRLSPRDVLEELEPYASEFLCTYVDTEGSMKGTNLAWFRELRRATRLPITAAGGIRSHREIRALARIRMDAAVGMALYLGKLVLTYLRTMRIRPRSSRHRSNSALWSRRKRPETRAGQIEFDRDFGGFRSPWARGTRPCIPARPA